MKKRALLVDLHSALKMKCNHAEIRQLQTLYALLKQFCLHSFPYCTFSDFKALCNDSSSYPSYFPNDDTDRLSGCQSFNGWMLGLGNITQWFRNFKRNATFCLNIMFQKQIELSPKKRTTLMAESLVNWFHKKLIPQI